MLEKELKVIVLLLHKSWKIRYHYKVCFVLTLLLPLIYPLLFIIFKPNFFEAVFRDNESAPIFMPKEKLFDQAKQDTFWSSFGANRESQLYYTPKTNYTHRVMQKVKAILEKQFPGEGFAIEHFKSEYEVRRVVKSSSYGSKNCGVVFENVNVEKDVIPANIVYNIIPESFMYFDRSLYVMPAFISRGNEMKGFFVQLQAAIDLAHLQMLLEKQNEEFKVNLFVRQIPTPPELKKKHEVYTDQIMIFSSFVTICLITVIPVLVKRIVEEKTTRMKEYLSCCGVTSIVYWLTTLIDALIIVSIEIILLLILVSLRNFSTHVYIPDNSQHIESISFFEALNVTYSLLFLSLTLYCLQSSVFACFISVFFNNPNVAAAVTLVVWPLSYLLAVLIAQFYLRDNDVSLLLYISLAFPNSAFFWLLHVFKARHFLMFEATGFSHLFETPNSSDTLSVFKIIFMMTLSTILYALLSWYLSEVWPFQEGVRKPWHFPISKLYKKYVETNSKRNQYYGQEATSPLLVSSVSKDFSTRKRVLKGVNFELKENSLTVLLGPNGSGKSTLINIVSGLTEATHGNVLVYGKDIIEKMNEAKSFLGICPQYNTYFKYLTVKEQLEMIYTLKCVLRQRIDGLKVNEILKLLDLESDANQKAHLLSGGNLRRMTLAMAMVGPCDVLVLDEPSESLDPVAKRKVWEVLIAARETKTILVCSHHLDEVNVIADFVAILVYGELKCLDTTIALKKKFGTGYKVKIIRNVDLLTVDKINFIIKKHVPSARLEKLSNEAEEIVFNVEFEQSTHLTSLFKELEAKSYELGIKSMCLSVTTLEDAYLNLIKNEGRNEKIDDKDWNFGEQTDADQEITTETSAMKELWSKYFDICSLLFSKNLKSTLRNYSIFVILIVIPILLLLIVWFFFAITISQREFLKNNNGILSDAIYAPNAQAFIDTTDLKFRESFEKSIDSKENSVLFHDPGSSSIEEWMLKLAENDARNFYFKFLFGSTFTKLKNSNDYNLTLWYNPSGPYSLPITVNLATKSLFNRISKTKRYSVTVKNKILSEEMEAYRQKIYFPESRFSHFLIHIIFIFILSIMIPAYLLRPIYERSNGFKKLQFMTGLHPIIYWMMNYIFDLLLNTFCSTIFILVYYVIDHESFFIGSGSFFLPTFLIFFFGGMGTIPFTYAISFLFSKTTTGYITSSITIFITGLILAVLCEVILDTTSWLNYIFMVLFPFFSFSKGIVSVHKAFNYNTFCDRISNVLNLEEECLNEFLLFDSLRTCCKNICDQKREYFSLYRYSYKCHTHLNPLLFHYDEITGLDCICFLTASALIYFTILIIFEYFSEYLVAKFMQWVNYLWTEVIRSNQGTTLETIFGDDVQEERNHVREIVRNRNISLEALVVDQLTKSFRNRKIPDNLSFTVHKGECFGLLGGNGAGKTTTFRLLTSHFRPSSGNAYIGEIEINLTQNTRKFLSKIGYCPQNDALLDFLTGFETLTLFMKLRGVQISMLLTSHNMDEVEALCSRVAVLANGKLRCIGALNTLKDKFGRGFTVVLKVDKEHSTSDEYIERVKSAFSSYFGRENSNLKYENYGVMYYNLTSESMTISNAFETMERLKQEFKLEDYIISNATLENALLTFMKDEKY
ncbi:ATP-binding cassette sub-family A member 1-like protein [Dinothrombium tinctorium]|uniref:ATP-binding cassette sub-family A member 1-like protein n=1 Tax=Dinothrombium tinctorium TaxID=1965070 RepID=A0A3S3PGN3_9ACAR|nr:ATP-binding cassette sub-family A member 1-like protein [Dinothrombium tinctorium]RWS12055.1 ATP-binding cassette sub-family A member 1-like protein [Dinothrombium tinctorium]